MKKMLVLCLCLFATPFALFASSNNSPMVEERHQLFILGVLSYLYNHQDVQPKPGWDIAALIAWDVENMDQTPEFVIDRNRNFEKQGNIFHAEIMTIDKAVTKKRSPPDSSKSTEENHKQQGLRLNNATLYSSLEPCPFCTLGISQSRIPNVIYFMQDPTTRDKDTYDPLPLPKEFCGKKLTVVRPSSLPLAVQINQELRNLPLQDPVWKYVITQSDGRKDINFGRFFLERQKELIQLAYEILCSYEVMYGQNKDLYSDILQAVNKD